MPIRATGQLNLSSKQEPHRYLARLTGQMHTAISKPLMWSLHVSTGQHFPPSTGKIRPNTNGPCFPQ